MLFISTVSYSVEAYGPDTAADNILSMAVQIQGEDGAETQFKFLTNKATEGYEKYFSNSLIIRQGKTKKITTVTEVWIPGLN